MGLVVLGDCTFNNQYFRRTFFESIAKECPTIYVDPPHSFLQRIENIRSYRRSVAQLHTIRPPKPFDNQQGLKSMILYLKKRIPMGETIMFFFPDQWLIAKELNAKDYIYFRQDHYHEFTRFNGSPEKVEFINKLESEIYSRVELVLTASYKMWEEIKDRTDRVIYFGHGTTPNPLPELERNYPPKLNEKIPGPRVVLAVHHIGRVDLDFVDSLAKMMPDLSFILVGKGSIGQMAPNIHFMGYLPRHKLYRIFCGSDVGLLVYRKNKFHHFVGPLKYYEYPSCGLPVVSSGIPEIEQFQTKYPKTFYGVQDPETAAQVIRRIIQDKLSLQSDIERFVAENTWEIRGRYFVDILRSMEVEASNPT